MNEELIRRALWLLEHAGPHTACELGQVLGCTTGEMENLLAITKQAGAPLEWVEVANRRRWSLKVSAICESEPS